MGNPSSATFAPMLYLDNVAAGIEFYSKAFGAVELRRINNDNGNVHVAEMTIGNSLFRLHEEVSRDREFSPQKLRGTTAIIGLLVDDPDEVFENAVSAGGIQLHGMQDHDYGYRQGTIADPFGHHWEIEKAPLVKSMFPQVRI